jgi:hypothetical protein
MTDSFTPADNYRLRFHVPSGVYQVAIRRGDHTVWAGDVETHPGHPPFLRLPPLDGRSKGPTTRLLP